MILYVSHSVNKLQKQLFRKCKVSFFRKYKFSQEYTVFASIKIKLYATTAKFVLPYKLIFCSKVRWQNHFATKQLICSYGHDTPFRCSGLLGRPNKMYKLGFVLGFTFLCHYKSVRSPRSFRSITKHRICCQTTDPPSFFKFVNSILHEIK